MRYKVEVTVRVSKDAQPYQRETLVEASGAQIIDEADTYRVLRSEVNRARDLAADQIAALIEADQEARAEVSL